MFGDGGAAVGRLTGGHLTFAHNNCDISSSSITQEALLESINQLEDLEDSAEDLPISPDGRFLLLSNTSSDPSSPTSLTVSGGGELAGQGDAAEAEAPDIESEA